MKRLITICTIIFVLAVGSAQADMAVGVLTFDDLPALSSSTYNSPSYAPILDGYGGAGVTWTNMSYMNTTGYKPSGYVNGTFSSPNVAVTFDAWDNPALVTDADGPFDFGGAYLTAAWQDALNIKVEGYLGSTLLYTKTVTVNHTDTTWCAFNYYGIDKLQFSSWVGTEGPDENIQFAMDNFTVVPVPGAVLLGVLGLGVAGWKLRRFA